MSLNRPIGPAHREADVAATLDKGEDRTLVLRISSVALVRPQGGSSEALGN